MMLREIMVTARLTRLVQVTLVLTVGGFASSSLSSVNRHLHEKVVI
jgi:hypothetical protein